LGLGSLWIDTHSAAESETQFAITEKSGTKIKIENSAVKINATKATQNFQKRFNICNLNVSAYSLMLRLV